MNKQWIKLNYIMVLILRALFPISLLVFSHLALSAEQSLTYLDDESPNIQLSERQNISQWEDLEFDNALSIEDEITAKFAFSLSGEPKYHDDFSHFDYVNPNAPKGGTLRLAEIGTYDNFNRYASRGASERSSASVYESLFVQSLDEIASYYPLLASSVIYADDYQWAEVTLNSDAYFHDGVPVTAEDVEFTFHKFMTEGVPQYRVYNQGVVVKALDKYHVRFEIPEKSRERLLTLVGDFPVLPKHFWQDKNLAEPLTEPPVGSAPYYIEKYKIGQYVTYRLDDNYWGKSLPVNQGLYNFKRKTIEYYMDDSVALEAFKAGEYDFRTESQPKNWFTQYQGSYFDQGAIIKQQNDIQQAVNTSWLAFNLEKPIFQDVRVRKALTLAFDFNWLNRAFYYNSYKQPMSFFENTPYAAIGEPSEQELFWLNQFADIVPAESFGNAYQLPQNNGDGFNRDNLLEAKHLLEQAGWNITNNQLVNQQTGEKFVFELLTYMGSDIKYAIPFQQSLQKLGITMQITAIDYAQINRRLRERDYDMIPSRYLAFDYPSTQLQMLWGSHYLNSSWNASGLHNQAIDALIAQIAPNIEDEAQLVAISRALDRILTYEYPMIPMWYSAYQYYAYWNKFSMPAIKPKYSLGVNSWWFDQTKASALPKQQAKQQVKE